MLWTIVVVIILLYLFGGLSGRGPTYVGGNPNMYWGGGIPIIVVILVLVLLFSR